MHISDTNLSIEHQPFFVERTIHHGNQSGRYISDKEASDAEMLRPDYPQSQYIPMCPKLNARLRSFPSIDHDSVSFLASFEAA